MFEESGGSSATDHKENPRALRIAVASTIETATTMRSINTVSFGICWIMGFNCRPIGKCLVGDRG